MSDLNVVRLSSLEDDDDERDGYRSYNSWRYVDEASLYSIAEDSREGQLSSQATDSRMSTSQNNYPAPPTDPMEDAPIEVRWVTAEEAQLQSAEAGGEHFYSDNAGGGIPSPLRDPDEVASQEEDEEEEALGPRHNARRSALFLLLLICAVVVIVLSLALALRNNKSSRNPTSVSGGVRDPDFQGPQIDPGDPPGNGAGAATPTPPAKPTTPTPVIPTNAAGEIDAYSLVWKALVSCPQTNPDDLTNIDTTQIEVFHSIVFEVETTLIKTDTNGVQSLDAKVGTDWILEKWGLLMLYFDTTGEFWANNGSWYSFDDTCSWYNEADNHCRSQRPVGGAAVTKLKLDANKLTGSLPKELCCMPLLEELVLSNNKGLNGAVPQCYKDGMMKTVDLSGNEFVATQSLESP